MNHQKRDYELSLIHDMLRVKGCEVRDIYGYVSREFGDPVFKITRIILNTDTSIDVEGEHDLPYIPTDADLFRYPGEEMTG